MPWFAREFIEECQSDTTRRALADMIRGDIEPKKANSQRSIASFFGTAAPSPTVVRKLSSFTSGPKEVTYSTPLRPAGNPAVQSTIPVHPPVNEKNPTAPTAGSMRTTTLSQFELPGDPKEVDPTPLKPAMQEIAPTSTIDAAIVTSPYEMQQLEPATCTALYANCISISSPLPQRPSNHFDSPIFEQQPNSIETPLSRDQLERARKNRESAQRRLAAARSDRTAESGTAVIQAACSPISQDQRKRAEKNREIALKKKRASLAITSTEFSQPLCAHNFAEEPRNVRPKLEVPCGMQAAAEAISSTLKSAQQKESFCGLLRDWPRPRKPCPDAGCGGDLVLKWGDVRRPHFAHVGLSHQARGCSGGESLMHLTAKEALSRYLAEGGKLIVRASCARKCMSDSNALES